MSCNEPLVRASFECLQYELGRLGRRWRSTAPRHTVRSVVRAAEDFVTVMFEDVQLAPFDELDDDSSTLVHDAYMRVLALAGLLDEARDRGWADTSDLACTYDCAIDLLDSLAPCVSYADRALRRVTLEGLEIEAACHWIDRQLRVETVGPS
jgi:hypothetical protein